MSTNKILIGGLIGGVVLFIAGFVLYGMAFSGFFEANAGSATGVGRPDEEMVFWALIVGNLAGGLLLAIIYGRWANISTLKTGFIAGAVIGLLMGISMDFVMYATTNMSNLTAALVDPLIMAVMWGLGGASVGWFFGRD
jgi:hypothetical protein